MKSVSGFILALIGGIGNIIMSLVMGVVVILLTLVVNGFSIAQTAPALGNFSKNIILVFILVALWFLISGILIIIYSVKINNDFEVRNGGILSLIFGILSINLFAIIGGIIGIAVSGSPGQAQQVSYINN